MDWRTEIAPVVPEYMRRMRAAGYGEKYRKDVLKHALGIKFQSLFVLWPARGIGTITIKITTHYALKGKKQNKKKKIKNNK